jgi:NADH-quinone oxidoreductase subunit J
MSSFLFTFFAVFTVGCALGVVVNRNAVNAAMCLLLSLLGVAALFVRLEAFLLAFLLLLVYAGAVVTLFLFIVMLLDVQGEPANRKRPGVLASAAAGGLLLAGVVSLSLKGRLAAADPAALSAPGASLKLYASELFTRYLLPVQVVGFLLLIAMLGVIVLSRKDEAAGRGKTG